jgi:hypothetical protein
MRALFVPHLQLRPGSQKLNINILPRLFPGALLPPLARLILIVPRPIIPLSPLRNLSQQSATGSIPIPMHLQVQMAPPPHYHHLPIQALKGRSPLGRRLIRCKLVLDFHLLARRAKQPNLDSSLRRNPLMPTADLVLTIQLRGAPHGNLCRATRV